MDAAHHERIRGLGSDYWWLEGKYRMVEELMEIFIPQRGNGVVFDASCGLGNFTKRLGKYGKCFGSDLSEPALQHAKSKGHPVFCANACSYPLPDASVDLLVMLDVLEHIREEEKAILETYRVLKSGGFLVLSVPAFNLLWGPHDEIYGHYRRYRVSELNQKLRAKGFHIHKNSYIEPLFFLPVFLLRRFKSAKAGDTAEDDFYSVPPRLNQFLTALIAAEAKFLKRWNFPFGVSMICIAEKNGIKA